MRSKKIVSVSISQNFVVFMHKHKNGHRKTRTYVPSRGSMNRIKTLIQSVVSSGKMNAVTEEGITIAEFVS